MTVKILDPKGLLVDGVRVAKGETIDAGGPRLKAWLHFKQVEPVDATAAPIKNPPSGSKGDAEKAQLASRQQDFKARVDARGQELAKLNRKDQLKLVESFGLAPVKDAKEADLVAAILQAEFGKEKEALGL